MLHRRILDLSMYAIGAYLRDRCPPEKKPELIALVKSIRTSTGKQSENTDVKSVPDLTVKIPRERKEDKDTLLLVVENKQPHHIKEELNLDWNMEKSERRKHAAAQVSIYKRQMAKVVTYH